MAKGTNQMWKLDLLEAKFKKSTPRFPHTKKLLTARNTTKLLKKLPTNQTDAENEINALKSDFFARKYHAAFKKLEKEVNKVLKQKKSQLEFFESKDNINTLITSKLAKCITTTILTSKEAKNDPPKYILEEVRVIILDKSHPSNPSCFFKTYCQNNKELNNFCSNLWNNKNIKSVLNEIEWSFKMIRGDLTKQEQEARKKLTGKSIEAEEEEERSGDESESEEDENDSGESEDESEGKEIDLEEVYDKFAVYDKFVGDSDAEQEEEEQFELDPNINYNEVTDEEASDESDIEIDEESESEESEEDDFFETDKKDKKTKKEKEVKEEKYKLPELASGYFSGGSDDEDDVEEDKVVKALTTHRKNRRGQRARQKIWEQKYGKEAKHVKAEKERYETDKQRRQIEFEERERKRELKRKLAEQPTGANMTPMGERSSASATPTPTPQPQPAAEKKIHPSWEAKRLAEEKLKNVKFQGKKITFD
ncbi:BUD22 [[Candida] subhashii]|uniref:BUD22 n=1 Tax=[Candida] subhashii TaxID=561895 RepID=A0A8J5QKS3_9ASCO|nr:BUD22 [[Candida] subhashii]KAG7662258.1 BUD22 [[Candida] subhashii]